MNREDGIKKIYELNYKFSLLPNQRVNAKWMQYLERKLGKRLISQLSKGEIERALIFGPALYKKFK